MGGEGEGKGERKHRFVSGTCVCDGCILLPGAFLVSYFLSSKVMGTRKNAPPFDTF